MLGVRLHQGVQIDLHQGALGAFVSDAILLPLSPNLSGLGVNASFAVRQAGPQLSAFLAARMPLSSGDIVLAEAGELPASKILCMIPPVWVSGGASDQDALKKAYFRCFEACENHGLRHLSLAPLIHDGASVPISFAGELALGSARAYLDEFHAKSLRRITFVLGGPDEYEAYRLAMLRFFPEVDQE